VEELNLGPPNTNQSSGREGDLNPKPLDYKSSAPHSRFRRSVKFASSNVSPLLSGRSARGDYKISMIDRDWGTQQD